MPIIELPKNGFMITEDYKYPKPRLRISMVFRCEDIRHFDTGRFTPNGQTLQSLVYFYADRNTSIGRTNYTGETKVTVASRHNSTHNKSDWLKKIRLPLIGVVESLDLIWDTDTRRAIEARLAHKMNAYGFEVANFENNTWTETTELQEPDLELYVEDVAELIAKTELAFLGLTSEAFVQNFPLPSAEELNFSHPIVSKNTIFKEKRKIGNSLFENPIEGRKLIARVRGITAYGVQTAEGKVIVTEINNLRDYVTNAGSLKPAIVKGQRKLLEESVKNTAGFYDWVGPSEPLPPSSVLSQAFGTPTANIWELAN